MSASAGRGPIAFTVRRPVATTMGMLAISTFGFISLKQIPLTLLPEISYPTVTVRTEYEGAGPEDVEERISRRIEETVAVLPGLERHSSVSRSNVSDVVLQFRWGTNLSFATQEIRERLDRTPLPDGAEAPLILRYDPSLDPVIRIAVSGGRDQQRLRLAADEVIARGLATIPGVAAVRVRGGLEEEIRVRLDARKIANLGLDISEVDRKLKIENVNLASGTLVEGDTEYLVRTLNQFQSLDEILDLAITDRDGSPIRMRDIGEVARGYRDRDVITRVNGVQSVELLVYREGDANIVDLAQAVRDQLFGTDEGRALLAGIESGRIRDPEERLREALAKAEAEKEAAGTGGTGALGGGGPGFGGEAPEIQALRAEVAAKRAAQDVLVAHLPAGVEARVLSDQSTFIRQAIGEVQGAAVLGGVLAVIVLLLFLRDMVATAIITTAIPISVVATFAPMFLAGTTLNIMSLGGLALGIGNLVDNAIVVLESIFRRRELGDEKDEAVVRGTGEVGLAVFASTLTTVAVFFPIVFVSGVAGQIFGDQAISVVCAQLSSLAVALFFIPMLAARALRDCEGPRRTAREALARPVATLAEIGAPVLPWRWKHTLAFGGWRSFVRSRKSAAGRLLVAVLLAPVTLVHLLVETCGRILLLAFGVVLLALLAVYRLVVRVVALASSPVTFAFDRSFAAVAAGYPRVLRLVLENGFARGVLFAGTAAVVLLGAWSFTRLGSEMLPTVHQGELTVHVHQEVGTPVEQAAAFLAPIERQISDLDEVTLVSSATGVARDEVADADEGSHSARLLVQLARAGDAELEERAMERIRAILNRHPEIASHRFSRPTLFSIEAPVAIEAKGDDLAELRAVATQIEHGMQQLRSLRDVQSTLGRGTPEIRLAFDRERMRRYGLDLEAIANRIRAQVQGVVSTRFADGDRRVDVRVLADITTMDRLLDMTVNRGRAVDLTDTLDRGREGGGASSGSGSSRILDRTLIPGTSLDLGSGDAIPLRQVAEWAIVDGPSEIRRINGQRAAVVTANTAGFDVGAAAGQLEALIARIGDDHPGLMMSVGGEGAEIGSALGGMHSALLLAVFLVYLVMACQFESIVQPLIILITIPLALVGALIALDLTGTPLSVVVLIGGIVLAGIVVNNAIVLIDYANRLRREGMSCREALVEAGAARLRPILMTTVTTVLGLLPLAGTLAIVPGIDRVLPESLWRGSELQAPLAVAVMGGLTLATVLTLVIIPVVYDAIERLRERARRPTA